MYSLNSIIKKLYEKTGVYVGVKCDESCTKPLKEYFEDKIPNVIPYDDFHSTLAYSKTWFEYNPTESEFSADIDKLHIFKNEKLGHTALVILLKSKGLEDRHKEIHKDKNASYDYNEYKPHITMSYDVSSMTEKDLNYVMSEEFLSELKQSNIKITGGKEYSDKLEINKYLK